MNIFKVLKDFGAHFGQTIVSALGFASTRGLSSAVVDAAKEYVKQAITAENSVLNNTEKREWVVSKLVDTLKLPESIARLAVELAVQAVKAKANKL